MKRLSLYFNGPHQVSVVEEPLSPLEPGEVLVQTLISAISPGTEMLVYRGQFPRDLPVDEALSALSGTFAYPLKYGYSTVGRVIATGSQVSHEWEGKLVFAFQPHSSHFCIHPDEFHLLPANMTEEEAVFLPNVETAVNFVLDGAPLLGEQVAVFGQGIVGLLTTSLLAQFPLASLVTLDRYPLRRQLSMEVGAHTSLDPSIPGTIEQARQILQGSRPFPGADLVFELSGEPAALDQAIAVAGFHSRVVIGSWYGEKRASLDLGGRFHRERIRLLSSQVSSLAPEISGRWTKERRFQVGWRLVRQINPSRFITHRIPFTQAAQAYAILDEIPEEAVQVVFTY